MPPADPVRPAGPSRPLPRGLLILAAALLVARVGTGVYEHQRAPAAIEPISPARQSPTAGVDLVAWVPADRAEAESRRTGKPILYEFSAEWCGPCRMMARDVFADAAAANQISQMFVPVRVADRQREEGHNPADIERLQSAYSIDAFPTLIVAWPGRGNYESKSGYLGREGTLEWLTLAAAKAPASAPGASADSTVHP